MLQVAGRIKTNNMEMKLIFATFIALFGLTSSLEVKFKDCGSKSAKVNHVYVDPCVGSPCILKKGSNSTISLSFSPSGEVSSVKAFVHGVIAGIPVPFPITGNDGCQKSGLTCPLKSGVEVKYFKTIPVSTSYPSLKLLVKWELKDQKNTDLACVEFPVQIKD